jgi:hypothetical protein
MPNGDKFDSVEGVFFCADGIVALLLFPGLHARGQIDTKLFAQSRINRL